MQTRMYDLEPTTADEWAPFLGDVSHNEVTVCDRTFTCRRVGDDSVWTADVAHADAPPSKECKVDILAAAGYASNCNVRSAVRSHSEACYDTNPYLSSGDRVVQLRSDASSNDMPMVLEGGWTCLPRGRVTPSTHRATHVENAGGLSLLQFEELPPTPEQSAPPPPPAPVAPAAPPPAAPPPAAPPPSTDPWTRCSLLSTRPQPVACSVDRDCPLTEEQYKEAFWNHVRDHRTDTFGSFLAHIRNDLNLRWGAASSSQHRHVHTRAQMKRTLMQMYDTDDVFRASVERAVDTDADFARTRREMAMGVCGTGGKCASTRTAPTERLFDAKGGQNVTFAVMEEDKGVVYTRNGVTREAHAIRCDASNRELCDAAYDLGDDPVLTRGRTPVTTTYKIRGDGSEFVVMNHLSVRGSDATRCTPRLCELNHNTCPSTECTIDADKNCVPRTSTQA